MKTDIQITSINVEDDYSVSLAGTLDMDGEDGPLPQMPFSFKVPASTVKSVYKEAIENSVVPAISKALLKLAD